MSLLCEAHKRDKVENLRENRESHFRHYFGHFCLSPGGALSCTPIWPRELVL